MIELNKEYFSSVNSIVNLPEYNMDINKNSRSLNADNYIDYSCADNIKELIDKNDFCVVDFSRCGLFAEDEARNMFVDLFGEPLIYKNPNHKSYSSVRSAPGARFYIGSHYAQPIHTDEGYTSKFPRYVALYCINQDMEGGDSILVQFELLYKQLLAQYGEGVDLLFNKNAITVHSAYGIENKPILLGLENGKIGISYSPILQKMRCNKDIFKIFEYITQYVHAPSNQIRFRLQPGQALLIDNCRVLHGRTEFSKNSSRLLHRYWFKSESL